MKAYLLRWNPVVSLPYEEHIKNMQTLMKNGIDDFSWIVQDYEDIQEGDLFIMSQIGTLEDGIVGMGLFTSSSYTTAEWKYPDGSSKYYADMEVHCLLDRRGGNVLDANYLSKLFPQIDWHSGPSGVLIPEVIVESLILYIIEKLLPYKKPTSKVSFFENYGIYDLHRPFAMYINGLCPLFRFKVAHETIKRKVDYTEGEELELSHVQVSIKKYNYLDLKKDSSLDELSKFFLPEL